MLYCHLQHHNNTIIMIIRRKTLTKYLPLTLLQGFEKGYSRFACERELETEQKLQYFDPYSYGRQCCVFLVLQMLNQRPSSPALCWMMAFFTASYQQLLWSPYSIGVPEGPSARCGFPYHTSSITPSPTVAATALTSVLTELYNSSMPTRSLKSHVWSSSSGNNCHAVHRSLSSGASVYECTMGIFYLVPFHQPISAHAISSHNCH